MYWVYILENPNGKYYIGHTDDLERRMYEHNTPDKGSGKFTHKNGPWNLVWQEKHPSRATAMAKEKFIKSRKSAKWIKINLLNK